MIIKTKDSLDSALEALQALLDRPQLTRNRKELIEEEIRNIRAGEQGEKQAAYHIDFHLKDSKNYLVIHDLRLEHNGRVAQIDHLIINRFFEIILIESKNISTGIRANEAGEFEVKTRFGWRGMASPVEQSKRHGRVLLELAGDLDLLPKRLGFLIRPKLHHWIVVPPECHVAKKPQDATLIKTDLFDKQMDQWIDRGDWSLMKVCSCETITAFAQALVEQHRPFTMDFAAKFGLPPEGVPPETPPVAQVSPVPAETAQAPSPSREEPCCESCGASLEPKVVQFCRLNRARLNGKLLCRTCQGQSRPATPAKGPSCEQCNAPVDEKVVAFCRFNSRKFGNRVLCRTCQAP